MAIKFITDSMSDPSEALKNKYDYEVIPIPITVGEKTYLDKVTITPEEIIEMGEKEGVVPKTSQISTAAYEKEFEKHLKNGDDIFYLSLSSGLSGTIQAANIAAEELKEKYPDRKIVIVDSKTATLAQAMLLQQAIKQAEAGKSIEEIEDIIKFLADHFKVYFVVGDLSWLSRGGRLSKTGAALGNLLNIVPIISIEDGKLEVFDKVRGKKKAQKKLEKFMNQALENIPDQIVGMIATPVNESKLDGLKKIIKEHPETNFIETEGGPGAALVAHTGGDLFGCGFFDELPEGYINEVP